MDNRLEKTRQERDNRSNETKDYNNEGNVRTFLNKDKYMLAWRVRNMWKSMAEKIQTLQRYFMVERSSNFATKQASAKFLSKGPASKSR